MGKIIIHQERITDYEALTELCPFDAIEVVRRPVNGHDIDLGAGAQGYSLLKALRINENCKVCKLCVKNGPEGVFEFVEEKRPAIDKTQWRGIAVYVDHAEGNIHPVTYELIGKAKAMAAKIQHPVFCVFMGHDIGPQAEKLLAYGVDEVFVYDDEALAHFRIEPYTAAFEDFIAGQKPAIVLVGGTTVGRSLAPRTAARFRTGLTADCTILDVQDNTDLDQIRPAFGGNIMAHIYTPNHRPQFATVRYKIFSAPACELKPHGKITPQHIAREKLHSAIRVLDMQRKQFDRGIEEAEALVVAGRGVGKEENLALVQQLADKLGAQMACTRPLAENGWMDPKRQIGLSGRTVKPKLIITCGVSGAVQFTAGMDGAERIIAINTDPQAPIFKVAHYGLVGDLNEILPHLIKYLQSHGDAVECAA